MRFTKRFYTDDLEKDCICENDVLEGPEENFSIITIQTQQDFHTNTDTT